MSLNFTVPKIEEFKSLPDGNYTAQVDHVEYVYSDRGNHHIVNWKILHPSEFEGMVHQERFNIEHENDQVRNIAIQNFGRFCVDIGGFKEGDEPKEDDFLYKIASISIRNKVGKDGRTYTNVIRRELADGSKKDPAQTLINPYPSDVIANPAAAVATGVVGGLNDEVPF